MLPAPCSRAPAWRPQSWVRRTAARVGVLASVLTFVALSAGLPGPRRVDAQAAPPAAGATALPAESPAFAARVDSLFDPWRGTDRPGCAVGVSHRGRVVLERGYGMADVESGAPMTPSTVVHAASIAKSVTAL